MKKENEINFLLFSYFGLTLNSEEEQIKEAAIKRTYQDAGSRVLSIEDKDRRDELKEKSMKEIKESFIKKLESCNSDTYDKALDALCKKLVEEYKSRCVY